MSPLPDPQNSLPGRTISHQPSLEKPEKSFSGPISHLLSLALDLFGIGEPPKVGQCWRAVLPRTAPTSRK